MGKPIIKTPKAKDLPSSHMAGCWTLALGVMLVIATIVVIL
jgi:hypothetical protein